MGNCCLQSGVKAGIFLKCQNNPRWRIVNSLQESSLVTSAIRRASTSAANECEHNNEVGIFYFHSECSNAVYAYLFTYVIIM